MEYWAMRSPILQFLMLGLLLQATAGAMGFLHDEGMVEAMRYAARYSGRVSFLAYLMSMLVFHAGSPDRWTGQRWCIPPSCLPGSTSCISGTSPPTSR